MLAREAGRIINRCGRLIAKQGAQRWESDFKMVLINKEKGSCKLKSSKKLAYMNRQQRPSQGKQRRWTSQGSAHVCLRKSPSFLYAI
jgi:hypothetical protein